MKWPEALLAVVSIALVACGTGSRDDAHTGRVSDDIDVDAIADGASWISLMRDRMVEVDESMPGDFGVHLRRLEDGSRFDHGDPQRYWYQASTIKVPVAIAVLELVEAGELSLGQMLRVEERHFVDGAGDLLWQDPGFEIRVDELVAKSLRDSDSTATDLLIGLVGEDRLNRRVSAWSGGGFNPITTIMQVRFDAYGPLHPGVASLTNMDMVRLRNADAGEARLQALARALGVARGELDAEDFDAVFERYYEGGLNAARLDAFGDLLEQLERGELLDETHTGLVLAHMREITTGDRRISAGLPAGTAFAQKTGTQIGRACNVGLIRPGEPGATVVVACAEGYARIGEAERAFQALGRAIAESGLLD